MEPWVAFNGTAPPVSYWAPRLEQAAGQVRTVRRRSWWRGFCWGLLTALTVELGYFGALLWLR